MDSRTLNLNVGVERKSATETIFFKWLIHVILHIIDENAETLLLNLQALCYKLLVLQLAPVSPITLLIKYYYSFEQAFITLCGACERFILTIDYYRL